ncbi:hypothetical protein H0H81_012468 [Sphagnurus paluster]|uniref:Uncharacterized protein n=1 Tax=Sphagnurus paluster TaxID=117069 RepID=A0A9P7GUW4_9AGAR|nr:hypothetical protein H0H81_012468 [Sphagnurus paluster]
MGNNKKGKRRASSPAESNRPAPSSLTSLEHQDPPRSYTPEEEESVNSYEEYIRVICSEVTDAFNNPDSNPAHTHTPILHLFYALLTGIQRKHPEYLMDAAKYLPAVKFLIAQVVSEAKALAPPPPMEVSSPTTPTAPRPPGATPPTQGNSLPTAPESGAPASATPPTPPAVPTPQGKPAPLQTPLVKHAPKHAPHPPPSQTAPKPSYTAALGSKAPRPRKAHPPTTLVAPASTKWIVIPNNKSQLRDAAKRPSPHHIVGAVNRELYAWAGKSIGGVQVANLGDSHILAATWTVGCNLLLTTTKVRDDHGLATPTYSTIVSNALSTIPTFSNTGVTVIPYRPAARLQIKGLPTWDPTTNHPIELTLVFQTLDGLGIFEGVKLIKNGPTPSDALSWAWDPKTFNAESCPCAVTVRFYNNDRRETGALLKKAFYLLGRRRRFDKWPPRPPPPKKG